MHLLKFYILIIYIFNYFFRQTLKIESGDWYGEISHLSSIKKTEIDTKILQRLKT